MRSVHINALHGVVARVEPEPTIFRTISGGRRGVGARIAVIRARWACSYFLKPPAFLTRTMYGCEG